MSIEQRRAGRVLLVDDDDDVRRGYARLLKSFGCDVETAADGHGAIEQLREAPFDVIVSDIAMPRMTGLEFLRAVREHDLDVPVILMTGAPALETAMKAVEFGAFRYIVKPVELPVLRDIVQRAVSMHQIAKIKREILDLGGIQGKGLGDRAALEARFAGALSGLWIAYQPIVFWSSRTVFGYEALVRSKEPTLMRPGDLFEAADRLGRRAELGRLIRRRIAQTACDAPPNALLFVNVDAASLRDSELYSSMAELSASAGRVVLEITESCPLHTIDGLGSRTTKLRQMGYRIALDDVGAGYAGLASFTQLDPDFVKLDMSLIRSLDNNARKRSVVRALVQLCARELGMSVIGEGVETPGERDALATEGCDLLQGFLFAEPEPGFAAPLW